jgi:peptidoglycan lytic transglycosylase G
MPPRPRPPRRTPKAVVWRRRFIALGILSAGFLVAWFAVDSVGGGGTKTTAATGLAAAPPPFRIVFPEAFTREQMAERVDAVAGIAERKRGKKVKLSSNTYLAATSRPRPELGFGRRPLEGFLFPATYDFTAGTTSAQLVAKQLEAFHRNWAKVNLSYARSKNLTPYDVLIIASMIEEETPAPEERQLVSAVIYNRLHGGIKLGIDATLRYGLNIPPTESIHESQLQNPTPFNTRKFLGLPPTPIGSPGLASLQAAAHPAKVNYLFFVAKPDKKHHFFTADSAAFERYKAKHGYK